MSTNVSNLVTAIAQGYYMSLVKQDLDLSKEDEAGMLPSQDQVNVWDLMDMFEEQGFSPGPDYDNRAW